MFDWDEDQESPVAVPVDASSDKAAGPTSGGLWHRAALLGLAGLFALAFAYENDALQQAGRGSTFDPALPAARMPDPGLVALPDTLTRYDANQARAFLRGLRTADTAIVRAYAARTQDDLARAGAALAPF